METSQKFTPDLKGCGKTATHVATSSIQKPVSDFGRTHLLLRNVSEYYTAFNRAHWGPYPVNCFDHCLGGGLACFLFDLIEDGCYRAVFKTQRYKEVKGTRNKVWFHIHEKGIVGHRETTEGEYQLFTVELGRFSQEGGLWQLCLNVNTAHPDNMFAFYEASLERLI
ncbi:hypothetical protein [Spirosoma sp.]|uniref:hypothetical protein n=1 Tax=Spirosoma sp. TaxID=1899569 RepID=UPI003B3AE4A4